MAVVVIVSGWSMWWLDNCACASLLLSPLSLNLNPRLSLNLPHSITNLKLNLSPSSTRFVEQAMHYDALILRIMKGQLDAEGVPQGTRQRFDQVTPCVMMLRSIMRKKEEGQGWWLGGGILCVISKLT